MAIRDEIQEYPYMGVITRTIEGNGDDDDVEAIIYQGEMDEHMFVETEGRLLQTSTYVISIPLTKDENGKYIIPHKGDKISIERYGETIRFVVDNSEPSQLGGVSIYATQKDWSL